MSTFVLVVVILSALRIITNVLALANGWKAPEATPLSFAFRVMFSAAWLAWGVYLLSNGAA